MALVLENLSTRVCEPPQKKLRRQRSEDESTCAPSWPESCVSSPGSPSSPLFSTPSASPSSPIVTPTSSADMPRSRRRTRTQKVVGSRDCIEAFEPMSEDELATLPQVLNGFASFMEKSNLRTKSQQIFIGRLKSLVGSHRRSFRAMSSDEYLQLVRRSLANKKSRSQHSGAVSRFAVFYNARKVAPQPSARSRTPKRSRAPGDQTTLEQWLVSVPFPSTLQCFEQEQEAAAEVKTAEADAAAMVAEVGADISEMIQRFSDPLSGLLSGSVLWPDLDDSDDWSTIFTENETSSEKAYVDSDSDSEGDLIIQRQWWPGDRYCGTDDVNKTSTDMNGKFDEDVCPVTCATLCCIQPCDEPEQREDAGAGDVPPEELAAEEPVEPEQREGAGAGEALPQEPQPEQREDAGAGGIPPEEPVAEEPEEPEQREDAGAGGVPPEEPVAEKPVEPEQQEDAGAGDVPPRDEVKQFTETNQHQHTTPTNPAYECSQDRETHYQQTDDHNLPATTTPTDHAPIQPPQQHRPFGHIAETSEEQTHQQPTLHRLRGKQCRQPNCTSAAVVQTSMTSTRSDHIH